MATAIQRVDPSQNDFLAGLEAKSGKPNHFLRTMANRPEVLKTFVPFYAAVVGRGSVAYRIKELVYLACAFANQCAYCTAVHTAGGRKAGITEDELQALQAGQVQSFTAPERAAIRYAQELTRTASPGDTRDALFDHFTQEQIVEMTLVVAMANFTNRFNSGLGVEPEA